MRGISRTNEFERIAALPRRLWEADPRLPELTRLLTEYLKTPAGTMALWQVQAAALRDCHDFGGLFGPIAVGRGKALVSILAPVVMEALRPLLLVPASLRDQTNIQVIPQMRRHWKLHPDLVVRGYSELSLAKHADMLNELKPDLIILDEAHSVKNLNAARTRRLVRYLHDNCDTKVVALSGTMTRKSIRDYHHLILWALEEGAPVPESWVEVSEWADALDVDVAPEQRLAPGVLKDLCAPGETAREAFGRRLYETPGVIATSEQELGTSLRIFKWNHNLRFDIIQLLSKMRETWCTPGGEEFSEAIDLWRHVREVSLGFYYKWNPEPPQEWMAARRMWKWYVRSVLQGTDKLDSELQVWNWCERGRGNHNYWSTWRDIKDTFKPNPIPIWVSPYVVFLAKHWLIDSELAGGGICWVEHQAFGEQLAAESGYPYFGGGERASRDVLTATGPIIVSIAAHSEGKNFQDRYSRNLVVSPPSSGKRWEQLLGRTHRPGQQADEVTVEVALFTPEHRASFDRAFEEAQYIQDSFGSRQKLLYADVSI